MNTSIPDFDTLAPTTVSPTYRRVALFPAGDLLRELLQTSIIAPEDWEALPMGIRDEVEDPGDAAQLLARLVAHKLLTPYQAERIGAGRTFGLILGNYRVLDHLGTGGMGSVYKAEHFRLRRPVAVKVFAMPPRQGSALLARFFMEMRTIAQLQHPNIVSALDAGEVPSPNCHAPTLHYFVMELIAGQNLENYIETHGLLAPAEACDLAYQVASALMEAHKQQLVHRDIKPPNILVTPEGQAKLLDFGLARRFCSRATEPGALLGTVGFMAPEQIRDASSVDPRADLFGLGCTLFWCLTGRTPFPGQGDLLTDLLSRPMQPPSVRAFEPSIPPGLDAVVARMMATKPDDRYPTAEAVTRALLPFLKPEAGSASRRRGAETTVAAPGAAASPIPLSSVEHRVLIVDDEAPIRAYCRRAIESDRVRCEEAANGRAGLEAVLAEDFDLVLLDIDMPEMTGLEVLRQLRERVSSAQVKVIMFSGRIDADEMAHTLLAGADDFLTKPFSLVQLRARVKAALRLKEAQSRSDWLAKHLLAANAELERNLGSRNSDLVAARSAVVLALAALVEYRNAETNNHLLRLQRYSRCLAEHAAQLPHFAGQIDEPFIQMVETCAPLHDIGKVGLPDHILQKAGTLTPEERLIMESHTLMGAEALKKIARQLGSALALLPMAIDIARHHHESYDGSGYPDRLSRDDIPLAARIGKVADYYDALRSRRPHKPALAHGAALRMMTELAAEQFDPYLLQSFQACAPQFERIFTDNPD
jgi:response regulator RpfG family c-di-GMP phosphodiesterase